MIVPGAEARPASPKETRRLRWWPHALALASALLVTLAAIAPLWLAALLWLAIAWFALPGVVLARRLYGGHPGAAGASVLVGPLWGFALSSLSLLVLWAAGLRHWSVILIAPPLAWLACRPLDGLGGALTPPALTRRDAQAALLLLCLVPLIVGRPYALVGAEVPDGRAYRAYFTADFVWTMAVTAEVSKGDVPPRNQFLSDAPLYYYWTPHLLSAVEYRHLGNLVTLEALLLVNALALGLAFIGFLYLFTRQFARAPALAAAGCAAAVVFTSFEGFERLFVIWREGLPLAILRGLNIDAVTRWFYGALPVDGLHRLLLYQPQHHAVAYALGFSALMVLRQARHPERTRVLALAGVLLAASLIFSAFAALMLTVMAAICAAILIAGRRAWSAIVPGAAVAAVPLGAATAAALLLQYVDRSGGIVELTVNQAALARPLLTFPLSFGPMLLTAAAGLGVMATRRDGSLIVPAVVVSVSAFFYFFVNVRDHQDVYVGWRAGHLFFMAAAPLTAVTLEALWRARGAVRRTGLAVLVALAVAAAPTVAIDLYNTQDIDNRAMGPGFPWTLVLGREELDALRWIRRHAPPDARVQVEPTIRAPATWAWVPAFAERRMAAGLPISMVPLAPYEAASAGVRELYGSGTSREAYDRAVALRIDYLVIGPPEREAYPGFELLLDADRERFTTMYRNRSFTIVFPAGGSKPPVEGGVRNR